MKMSLTIVGGSAESSVVNSVAVGLNVVVRSKLSGSVVVILYSPSVAVVIEFIVGSLVSPSTSSKSAVKVSCPTTSQYCFATYEQKNNTFISAVAFKNNDLMSKGWCCQGSKWRPLLSLWSSPAP